MSKVTISRDEDRLRLRADVPAAWVKMKAIRDTQGRLTSAQRDEAIKLLLGAVMRIIRIINRRMRLGLTLN